jgi:hypothetical protein
MYKKRPLKTLRNLTNHVMAQYVTIPAEPSTRERIKSHLEGGERYTDLLERLVDAYEEETA